MAEDPAALVNRLAADLGFALCGVCEARPSDHAEELRAWLDAGRHGEMAWLAENVDVRVDPRQLIEGARSIVCVGDRLPPAPGVEAGTSGGEDRPVVRRGVPARIARYAQVTDYHRVLKKRLFRLADALRQRWPAERFRVCVDTAPILEREHAGRAGIGWVGKHTLLLNRDVGSHLLLGEIVTTLDLAPDHPELDHCGTCTRCIDACPTDAITPRSVDATRCISYLTIEHRSAINPVYHEAIGDWLFGCDICQDVCPFVERAERAARSTGTSGADACAPPPGYDLRPATLSVIDVLDWDESARRAAFTVSAMKRAKLDMIKRNALIVAGNALRRRPDDTLRRRIEQLAVDDTEAELVRTTARQVLDALKD